MGCLVGGLAPDVDFLFLFFPFFNAIHRVGTHNVFFVTGVALVMMACNRTHRLGMGAGALGCGFLHLFIDAVMDNNPSNGIGVALIWPLSGWMFSPFNLLRVQTDHVGWTDVAGSLQNAMVLFIIETPLVALSLWLAWKNRHREPLPSDV